jgi:hypothetical protein
MTREELKGVRLARLDRERESERELLFALFDEAPMSLILVEGAEQRITRINRRVRESSMGPKLIGKTTREIYPTENAVIASLDRVYKTGIAERVHGTEGCVDLCGRGIRFNVAPRLTNYDRSSAFRCGWSSTRA